jgi:cytochrome oxidase assembly protein ShyY1
MERNYRFALTPRWITGHAVAVTFAIVFVLLGMWQLRRHDERREFNAVVTTRLASDPVSLPALDLVAADPERVDWLPVTVTGSYQVDDEVLLVARTLRGRSGHDVLTPLHVGDITVIVDRGWVPIDAGDPPISGAEPPRGPVTVTGVLRTTQVRGTFGPTDPAEGPLDRISRVDVARLDEQTDKPLYPMWIQLTEQAPAGAAFPEVQALPETDAGPHLSYAVQWFAFAGVIVVAYPLLMRRTAQRPGRRADGPSTEAGMVVE